MTPLLSPRPKELPKLTRRAIFPGGIRPISYLS